MAAPTIALVVVSLTLTVVAGPLFALAMRAAGELHEQTPYIQAVLGGGA